MITARSDCFSMVDFGRDLFDGFSIHKVFCARVGMESKFLFIRSKEEMFMENKFFSCVACMEKETRHFSKELTICSVEIL